MDKSKKKTASKKLLTSNENNLFFKGNPEKLQPKKELADSATAILAIDDTFAAFKTLDNKYYLVYGKNDCSLEIYDLIKENVTKTIPKAHEKYLTTIKHYIPENEKDKKDLLITSSCTDRCVKIWDIKNNFKNIVTIKNAHDDGDLRSLCLFNDPNQKKDFLVTSSHLFNEPIKLWELSGKFLCEMNHSKTDPFTSFIDTFFDEKSKKTFIISGNERYFKSFDYDNNTLYQRYQDKECSNNSVHISGKVLSKKNQAILIESGWDGYIRVWDFDSADLEQKIKVDVVLNGICLWSEELLFVGCDDFQIKLIDLDNEEVKKSFRGHSNRICSVKKLLLPNYGECLISHSCENGQIKLWTL